MIASQFKRFEINLIHDGNRMQDLLRKSDEYTADDPARFACLLRAANIACNTLRQLQDSRDFEATLARIESDRLTYSNVLQQFFSTDDQDEFDYFLSMERRILVDGGMNEEWADKVIFGFRDVLLSRPDALADATRARGEITRLREQACQGVSVLLKRDLDTGQPDKGPVRRWALGIGGACAMGLNYSPVASLNGTTAFFSHVSGVVAGWLINRALG